MIKQPSDTRITEGAEFVIEMHSLSLRNTTTYKELTLTEYTKLTQVSLYNTSKKFTKVWESLYFLAT